MPVVPARLFDNRDRITSAAPPVAPEEVLCDDDNQLVRSFRSYLEDQALAVSSSPLGVGNLTRTELPMMRVVK